MFTKELTGLTLTSKVADTLFQNISGDHFHRDETFLATLRALLHSRVPKEESVHLKYVIKNYSVAQITDRTDSKIVEDLIGGSGILDGATGVLCVCSLSMVEDAVTAALKAIDNGGEKKLKGYVHLEDVEKFLEQRKVRARIMLSEESKNTIVFMERIDLKRWHLIQALTTRYLPWYFKENPLNTEESTLIKSLTGRYAPDYEAAIEVFADKFDFKTQEIRAKLSGFETAFEKTKLKDIRREMERIRETLESLDRQIAEAHTRWQDLSTDEFGLMEKIRIGVTDDDSELMKFFINSKALELIDANNGRLEFWVKTYISHWDPELFGPMIRNKNSCFYADRWANNGKRFANGEFTDERIERLMKAIFENETVKLRVCAKYYLDFVRCGYGGFNHIDYPEALLRTNTPNQHIQEYACLGNNHGAISQCVREKEYVGAVVSCIASASNINLGEPHTVSLFMREISKNTVGRIIELPDGTCVTPVEAAKWLEENGK